MRLRIVNLRFNVGHQAAIFQGFLYARTLGSQHFVVMDSDGEDSPTATNQLTLTFNTVITGNLSVHGSNVACGIGAESPALNIQILAGSVPTVLGNSIICAGDIGNVYTTEAGKANYVWAVTSGGTITAGGTSTSNTVTVTWNAAGANTVSVSYQGPPPASCPTGNPTVYNVQVYALPVPVISGPASACVNTSGNVYSTASGMTGYFWNVSLGGTITSGAGTSLINVTWNTTGAKTVTLSYTDSHGCSPVTATVYNVMVNTVSSPSLSGPSIVCLNSVNNVYTTESGNTNYVWTVSAGGVITGGGTTSSSSITVTWATAGAKTVSVNYTNSGSCAAGSPTVYNITVVALPVPTISGPSAVCLNSNGIVYTTQSGNNN